MKPRLSKHQGFWFCAIRDETVLTGIGLTPAQAYADWSRLTNG